MSMTRENENLLTKGAKQSGRISGGYGGGLRHPRPLRHSWSFQLPSKTGAKTRVPLCLFARHMTRDQ